MKKTLIILSVLCLGLAGCASRHHDPFDDHTPAVRDLNKFYNQLKQTIRRSPELSLENIGTVAYGSFEFPILCVSYRSADSVKTRPRILIDAGVHGNEPAGAAFAVELIDRLARQATPLKEYDLDIIPVVNPWGWSRDIRFNKEGFDINRDFSRPDSREAKILMEFLRDKRYDLVMDLHEDPNAQGVYFYQYARKDKTVLTRLVDKVGALGYPIENDISFILLKTDEGIIDAPMWGLLYVKFTDQLSMSNYCRLKVSDNVFTIETPPHLPEKERIAVHRTATRLLTEALLAN